MNSSRAYIESVGLLKAASYDRKEINEILGWVCRSVDQFASAGYDDVHHAIAVCILNVRREVLPAFYKEVI